MLMVITFKVDNMRKIVENSIMRCLVFGLMICMCLQASGQDSLKCEKYIYVGVISNIQIYVFPTFRYFSPPEYDKYQWVTVNCPHAHFPYASVPHR